MLYRKVQTIFDNFKKQNKALLITGARQVGKTYIIREFGKNNFESFCEINFIQNEAAKKH